MQVFSRIWALWLIIHICPEAQTSIFASLACISWGLVEVPRYLFYAAGSSKSPYPLQWLRYSLFAILYPTGITGELGCMYTTLLYLRANPDLYTMNIGEVNIAFWHVIIFIFIVYVPGSPFMYMNMVRNRRKWLKEDGNTRGKLDGKDSTKTKKTD